MRNCRAIAGSRYEVIDLNLFSRDLDEVPRRVPVRGLLAQDVYDPLYNLHVASAVSQQGSYMSAQHAKSGASRKQDAFPRRKRLHSDVSYKRITARRITPRPNISGACQVQTRVGRRRLPRGTRTFQLFPNDLAKYRFNWTFPLLHRAAECVVHESLVVSTTGSIHLLAEPLKDIVVNTNRDSGLARRRGDHWTTLGLAKIVLFLHGYFPSG